MKQMMTNARKVSLPVACLALVAAAVACSDTNKDNGPGDTQQDGGGGGGGGGDSGGGGGGGGGNDAGTGGPAADLVNCVDRANEKHVKCTPSQVGTVGTGPKFTGGLSTQVNHGFIAGNQLVVAVEFSGLDDEYGGIFGIDLTTGNRTLLSGKYADPTEGDLSKGSGPDGTSLNQVRDVTPGPGNTWYALAARNLQSNRTIFSINPATGDRKVIFDAAMTSCEGLGDTQVGFDPSTGLAVGPDGSVYVGLNNMPQSSGKGIAKVTADGKCSVVTLSGSEAHNKGAGPNMIGSFLYNVTYRDNLLYVLQFNTHSSIMSVDPATGNRKIISVSPDKGTGPDVATDSMTIAPDGTFWTYNAYRGGVYGLVSVDPVTGNRTASEPKGGPAKMAQGADRGIWVHPNGKNLILQYGNALIIYDPATGNSNTLSY